MVFGVEGLVYGFFDDVVGLVFEVLVVFVVYYVLLVG